MVEAEVFREDAKWGFRKSEIGGKTPHENMRAWLGLHVVESEEARCPELFVFHHRPPRRLTP